MRLTNYVEVGVCEDVAVFVGGVALEDGRVVAENAIEDDTLTIVEHTTVRVRNARQLHLNIKKPTMYISCPDVHVSCTCKYFSRLQCDVKQ